MYSIASSTLLSDDRLTDKDKEEDEDKEEDMSRRVLGCDARGNE